VSRHFSSIERRVVKRTSSCPPGRVRNIKAGPWTLEWINRHKGEEAGRPFSFHAKVSNKVTAAVSRGTKKKGGGPLHHCSRCLKHIARLSDADRKEVLCALRKNAKKRKVAPCDFQENSTSLGSQASVNKNDWSNWLVLHGNEKAKSDDVRGIGKMVGLNYQGDKNNMFDVLSGAGRKNKEGVGRGV
jgi:hypothetical protein